MHGHRRRLVAATAIALLAAGQADAQRYYARERLVGLTPANGSTATPTPTPTSTDPTATTASWVMPADYTYGTCSGSRQTATKTATCQNPDGTAASTCSAATRPANVSTQVACAETCSSTWADGAGVSYVDEGVQVGSGVIPGATTAERKANALAWCNQQGAPDATHLWKNKCSYSDRANPTADFQYKASLWFSTYKNAGGSAPILTGYSYSRCG